MRDVYYILDSHFNVFPIMKRDLRIYIQDHEENVHNLTRFDINKDYFLQIWFSYKSGKFFIRFNTPIDSINLGYKFNIFKDAEFALVYIKDLVNKVDL